MTREEANKRLMDASVYADLGGGRFIDGLVALGLLKIEEPAADPMSVALRKLNGVISYLHADDDKHSARARSSAESIVRELVAALSVSDADGDRG